MRVILARVAFVTENPSFSTQEPSRPMKGFLPWSNNTEKDRLSDVVEEICRIENMNHHAELAVITRFSKHCSMTGVFHSPYRTCGGLKHDFAARIQQQMCYSNANCSDVFDNTRQFNRFQCKQQTLQTNTTELKCAMILWIHCLVIFLVGHWTVMVSQLVHASLTLMVTNFLIR